MTNVAKLQPFTKLHMLQLYIVKIKDRCIVLKALRLGVAPYLLWTPRRGEATPYTNVKAAY